MTSINRNDGLSKSPLNRLSPDDLELVTQLVLQSGSLKDLATVYRVSYPTIRARLDQVIKRLEAAVAGRPADPLSDLLATLVERNELSMTGARAVRDLARTLVESRLVENQANT